MLGMASFQIKRGLFGDPAKKRTRKQYKYPSRRYATGSVEDLAMSLKPLYTEQKIRILCVAQSVGHAHQNTLLLKL